MAESFPMVGGNGDYSYAKHSMRQKQQSDSTKDIIEGAILEKLELHGVCSSVWLADFGCSIGPNTFFDMQHLMEAVEKKYSDEELEFQVFFNDHSTNDFNTLFANLPPQRKYRAAGVPGSFYARLFPRASITLGYSSHSLPWLSRVPDGIKNKGRIHYTGAEASQEVVNAYGGQFERDFGDFLNARAEEMVKGGLMFVILPCTPQGVGHSDLSEIGLIMDLMGSSLMDLAHQGIIEESEIDSFNIPVYFPNCDEMRREIEKNGCFSIERLEETYPTRDGDSLSMMMHARAAMEGVFIKYFDHSVVDKMFVKAFEKARQISQWEHLIFALLCLVLKRR